MLTTAYWILLVLGSLASVGAVKALFEGKLAFEFTDLAAVTWAALSTYIAIQHIFFGA